MPGLTKEEDVDADYENHTVPGSQSTHLYSTLHMTTDSMQLLAVCLVQERQRSFNMKKQIEQLSKLENSERDSKSDTLTFA